jgi:hypothetical protein
VSEVAFVVGFKNVSHFSRSFSRHFQVAPRDVRQTPRLPDARVARRPSKEGGPGRHTYGSAPWHSEPAGAFVHS